MNPVGNVSEVFDAIQVVKAGAPAFCTNFFPVQKKLQTWIEQGELMSELRDGTAFFLRKDRDFLHLYFCAASLAALQREITELPDLHKERVVVDLVGNETVLGDVLAVLGDVGFRRYARLQRMARPFLAAAQVSPAGDSHVITADAGDSKAILDLLDRSFDRYADQLPTLREVQEAIESRQMLAIKHEGALAALLFFETHGLTSTVRYWVVAEKFQSRRFGSALMRYYFAAQSAVRRFILWVVADNKSAVEKYRHYGYVPDGLVDHVLANQLIRP